MYTYIYIVHNINYTKILYSQFKLRQPTFDNRQLLTGYLPKFSKLKYLKNINVFFSIEYKHCNSIFKRHRDVVSKGK